jgi:hypothetical protein
MNKRTDDLHYPWTKKWGAGQDAPVTRHEPPRFFLASETNLPTLNANGRRLVLRTI